MLKQFRQTDLTHVQVTALHDAPGYFKDEEKRERQQELNEFGCYLPKGNPFNVSGQSDVLLFKERKK